MIELRTRRASATVVAAVLALVLVALCLTRISGAAFSGDTGSDATLSTGSVTIEDDDAGSVMFDSGADGLLDGGASLTRCIAVTYTGSLTTDVRVRLSGAASGALAPHLNLTVDEGTGGGAASCTGFTPSGTLYTGTVADFAATHDKASTGVSAWAPTGHPETRTYRLSLTVANTAAAQSKSATGTFTWTARSGPDPFTPADLSDKALWLRPGDLPAPGTPISTWADQSGNGNVLVTTGAAPVVTAGTPSGAKAVDFTGKSPLGTSDDLGLLGKPFVASAKTYWDASLIPANVADGDIHTAWACSGAGAPTWVAITSRTGPVTATSYQLTPREGWNSHGPQAWTFEGSNDGTTWSVLDSQSGQVWADVTKNYPVVNSTAFTQYRLNITVGGWAGAVCDLAEFALNGVSNSMTVKPGEVWVVLKANGNNGTTWGRFNPNGQSAHYAWSDNWVYETFARTSGRASFTPYPAAPTTGWRVLRITNDGSVWRAYVDGVKKYEEGGVPYGWLQTGMTIGGRGGGDPFNGQIAEMLVRGKVSTAAEATQMATYLNATHGLNIATS